VFTEDREFPAVRGDEEVGVLQRGSGDSLGLEDGDGDSDRVGVGWIGSSNEEVDEDGRKGELEMKELKLNGLLIEGYQLMTDSGVDEKKLIVRFNPLFVSTIRHYDGELETGDEKMGEPLKTIDQQGTEIDLHDGTTLLLDCEAEQAFTVIMEGIEAMMEKSNVQAGHFVAMNMSQTLSADDPEAHLESMAMAMKDAETALEEAYQAESSRKDFCRGITRALDALWSVDFTKFLPIPVQASDISKKLAAKQKPESPVN
jgi:hypothetical protein